MPTSDYQQRAQNTVSESKFSWRSILAYGPREVAITLNRGVMHLGSQMLDFLAPPRCPITGELVHTAGDLSGAGWAQLHFLSKPRCERCGRPFELAVDEGTICGACIAAPPVFQRARAAVAYDDQSRRLIIGFKHSDRTEHALLFSRWLVRAGEEILQPGVILVPVPLHWRRTFSRRYNQAALLTRAISNLTGLAQETNLLRRHRATPPQAGLAAAARKRNVNGAFSVRDDARARIENARIVLVDDVYTTGATLSACARVLRKAGAKQVDALTVARVVKQGGSAV